MGIIKTIIKPVRNVWREYKRRINRPNMPCDFSEGVTQGDLAKFATLAAKSIKGKRIEVSAKGAVVKGLVQSNSGLSTWMFSVDFNDYGHITGNYWLKSENEDSPVPQVIGNTIRSCIEMKLDGLYVDENEYYCPHCNAILNYQRGFSPANTSWVCKGCGQQLFGDDLKSDVFGDVVWYCDNCGAVLNKQPGFTEEKGIWHCSECGFENDVTEDNIEETGLLD